MSGTRKLAWWLTAAPWVYASALAGPAHQPAPPCHLVEPARVQALAPHRVLPLHADEPGTLSPRDLPGLPVAVRIEQCTSAAGAGGAIGFRIGLITVPRELTAAEWAAVGRALDHAEPMHPGTPQCAVGSEPGRSGGPLHTTMCGQTRGRYRVEIGFEHRDATRLPSQEAVRGLLADALSRL